MRDLDQISQPGHAERARTPHGIVPVELRGGRALGRLTQCATALSKAFFRCAMLAFVRDPFMTLAKLLNPVTLNTLGMDNGPAMHPPCRPAQPSCACSVARVGLEACRSVHSRPVCGPV